MPDPLRTLSEDALRDAFALEAFDGRAAQRLMEPFARGDVPGAGAGGPFREAAALAYVSVLEGGWRLPLTLRHAALREHSGQVSLPGGRPDEGEDLWQTALREAQEEIGLDVAGARRLGTLSPVDIPITRTRLHVHVACGPPPGMLQPNPAEVVRVQFVSLDDLLAPGRRRRERRRIRDVEGEVPYFDFDGLQVWGATAMALSELAERLRAVLVA